MNDTLLCGFWNLLVDLPFVSRMESPTESYRNTGNLESVRMPSLISSLPCLSRVTTYTASIFAIWSRVRNDLETRARQSRFLSSITRHFLHEDRFTAASSMFVVLYDHINTL